MPAQRSEAIENASPLGPRLHGVPVPLRAFGFAAGWCHADVEIDLRSDVAVMQLAADRRAAANMAPRHWKRTAHARYPSKVAAA
jgi:hypothetical protein